MNPSINFAYEGFRIIRSKPYAVLAWGLFLLIGNGLALYALVSLAGPSLQALQQMQPAQQGPATMAQAEAMMKLFPAIMGGYGIAIPIQLVANAFVSCAVYRAVFEKEDKGVAWLGFGAPELRQIAVAVLFTLLMFVALIAAVFAATLVASLMAYAAGSAGAVLGTLAVFAAMLVVAGIAVRLSFCGVQTFDENSINLFGSWKLTEGRFWWLTGGYLLTGLMVLLVYALCFAIFAAFAAVAGHGDIKVLDPIIHSNGLSMDMFRQPVTLAYLAVSYGLVAPLAQALMTGAPASAYRGLKGVRPATRPEQVF